MPRTANVTKADVLTAGRKRWPEWVTLMTADTLAELLEKLTDGNPRHH